MLAATMKYMAKYWKILLIALLILLPMLSFPVSNDHFIFMHGGSVLLDGGTLYTDFIDIKPPLIYYIFAGIDFLFGSSEMSIRVFDLIWQMFSVMSLLYVISSNGGDRKTASSSAIIYSLLYTTLNYSMTLQCETIAGLPLIWVMHFYLTNKSSIAKLLLVGVLLGLVAALKVTLGIVFLAIVAMELIYNEQKREAIRNIIFIALGSLLGFLVGMLPFLLDSSTWGGYQTVFEYMTYYSSIIPVDINLMRMAVKKTSYMFGDTISLSISILSAFGLFVVLEQYRYGKLTLVLLLGILITLALLISVAAEMKFAIYHFSRIYLSLSIIAGAGTAYIINQWSEIRAKVSAGTKLVLALSCAVVIVFSPLPRMAQIYLTANYFLTDTNAYDNIYSRPNSSMLIRNQMMKVRDYLEGRLSAGDMLIVMSTGGQPINQIIGHKKISAFGQSQFYFSLGVPGAWTKKIHDELNRAQWVVVQNNDRHFINNGHNRSSEESLEQSGELYNNLRMNFTIAFTTENLRVYERIIL